MTDKIDLLPLPEDYADEGLWGKRYGPYSLEMMEDYARANVARAIAAKDAEIDSLRTRLEDTVRDSTNKIEALRAEVAEWKRVAAAQAELHDKAEARVERLTEALRLAEEHIGDLTPEWYNSGQRVLAAIRAARKQEDV